MEYRAFGRTGIRVSALCFGTMSFGGDADQASSAAMYRACRDAGINFFDTADQYNRDELVIATKCFNPTHTDLDARGNSRRHVTRAIEASLKRLQTDRVLDIQERHGRARRQVEHGTGRLSTNKMYEARYGEPWMHEVASKFVACCRGRGHHPVSLAVAWVAAHPAVTAPIIGARNVEQLRASLDSVKIRLTPGQRTGTAALSRTPPPATDRLEEQKK
ncbi:MAG: aldo/keto reductase [Betaproteobacteria bacterium]|nr:MAG: aldo/keto reductase [Betaproteobacteria bacterium]